VEKGQEMQEGCAREMGLGERVHYCH